MCLNKTEAYKELGDWLV